ncbi:MAG: calcium/proton exchanger [Actinomycetota bacterium]|nr:calcium/proton exchanger [Actinomycetota bacterium]
MRSPFNWLLVAVPVALLLGFTPDYEIAAFIAAAIAIVPLARLMGEATEQITRSTGAAVGAFLNASFGNATELIIAVIAVRRGLFELVKASITGSIIGNILIVLGLAMLAGGWSRQRQHFDRTAASANSALLLLAVIALVVPAVYDMTVFGHLETTGPTVEKLSLLVSFVLIVMYGLSLLFTFRTHRAPENISGFEPAQWKISTAASVLAATALAIAVVSEVLVGAVEVAAHALGMTELFVGVVIVAVIGNAAEHATAVQMAVKNKMDIALGIAVGSSIQIALFVAPVIVFASWLMGKPMSLIFTGFEIVAVALSVAIASLVSLDGESNWLEGAQLIAVYLILAIAFYFIP